MVSMRTVFILLCSPQPEICSAFSLADCSGDSVVEFSVETNLSRHSHQLTRGCVYLPIDSAW